MLKRFLCVKEYANKGLTPLKLKYIYNFGNQNKVKEQAQFLHQELPIRLAKRVVQLEQLPGNITNLESLQRIHELYIDSFERILNHSKVNSSSKIESFAELLSDIKSKHSNIELDLSDCIFDYRFNNPEEYNEDCQTIDKVLDDFYMSRIGIRFLIGQHLNTFEDDTHDRYVGIIDKKCNPYKIIEQSINKLKNTYLLSNFDNIDFEIKGNKNLEFMHIPSHLYYIFFELLKNSAKAVIDDNLDNPKISIFIEKGKEDILIRISDRGIGIKRELNDYVFSYLYTTTKNENQNIYDNQPILSGFAHGLGLSRLYARYLGGDLKIISTQGIGTDNYIHIKTINPDENIN